MSIEKLTTQKNKKAIKADEKLLGTLQKGSKEGSIYLMQSS